MSFVKLTGEQGQEIGVKPLWVYKVEEFVDFCVLYHVGGGETMVFGTRKEVEAALCPPTEPKRTTVRRVGAE